MISVRHFPKLLLCMSCMLPALQGAPDGDTLRELLKQEPPIIAELQKELDTLRNDKDSAKQHRERISELRRSIAQQKAAYTQTRNAFMHLLKKVEQSGNINARDDKKRTLLMLAAATGIDKATELVLQESPELNLEDNSHQVAYDYERQAGGTVITEHLKQAWDTAAGSLQTEQMAQLLDCGADPNWAVITGGMNPNLGEAPTILALQQNHTDALNLLLSYGASAEARTQDGRKLVELAVENRQTQILIALLQHGCKTDTVFADGRPMFEHLLAEGAEECLDIWLDAAAVGEQAADILCSVVRLATPRAVQLAFSKRKDFIHAEDSVGNMPLHEAARRGVPAIYNTLLELGADATAHHSRNETTLMHAALSGNAEMLSLVLQNIPQELLHAKDAGNHTAIHYARLAKDPAAEATLRNAGLSPQPQD